MIEKKDDVKKDFDKFQEEIDDKKVKQCYTEHSFNKTNQEKTFISTDGSYNSIKYLDGILYAVSAVTLLSKPDYAIQQESEESDIDVYPATNMDKFNSHISRYMEILEVKNTLKTLKDNEDIIDYILIDGSLQGQLNHFNINQELDSKIENLLIYLIREFEKELNDNTFDVEIDYYKKKSEIELMIRSLINSEEELKDFDYKDKKNDIKEYYMGLELLACITHLITNYSQKIIGISKTSRSNKLFKEDIPDSAVIEYCTNKTGYTEAVVEDSKKLVRPSSANRVRSIEFPLYKDKIMNYKYITLFARLEDKKNVIKIEIPLKDDSHENTILSNIKEILEDLYSCSINGYPYILKRVHDTVVIKNTFMERMEKNYEFTTKKRGREMLN